MTTPTLSVRLRQIRLEANAIASYEFVSASATPLPPFEAGAHIDLHLPNELIRSYSLVNPPSERERYVVAVQREADGHGGSAWMHAVPRVGDVLQIGAPLNDFALDETARASVFIAGGIGITPVVAMLHRLNALARPWRLHYAARSPDEAAFVNELHALEGESNGAGVVEFCFRSSRSSRLDLAAIAAAAPADAHLYCCGPGAMIDAFQAACAGRAAATVHTERFSASAEADTAGGFDLLLERSGRRITVQPGKTILDTLLDHAVEVNYACSAGVCGTCVTRVISGVPEHRDDYLTDAEKANNESIMICCSGSRTPTLVLDL
ncbi:MAG TPA: PDR/VanB family oxidoreductase [Burkholderiaceae bacterium]|jgi:vanillate O-demethylase ferredoxin subunit